MALLARLGNSARTATLAAVAAACCCTAGCRTLPNNLSVDSLWLNNHQPAGKLMPSHNRDWLPDVAVLPHAEIQGDQVTLRNIRNCKYREDDEYVIQHYDRTFDLKNIRTVDFIVAPFKEAQGLAHTMLSFGFADGQFVCISVEARLEKGEQYSPVLGALRQYELMYVVADERDVIVRRTRHRDVDVYLYRTVATPEQVRVLFLDVVERINGIYREPEFYDSLTNNCTTNIVQHANRVRSTPISMWDPRVLLPGYADQLAYELELLDTSQSFEQLRAAARINEQANRHALDESFSQQIRRGTIVLP